MFLTSESLPSYLLQRAVLREQDVVTPGLLIIEMSRRNRNFKVVHTGPHAATAHHTAPDASQTRDAPLRADAAMDGTSSAPFDGCFVKQAGNSAPHATATLYREAEFYRRIATDAALRAFAPTAPELLDYDPVRHVMTLGLLPDSRSISQIIMGQEDFRPDLAQRLGHQLALLHQAPLPSSPQNRSAPSPHANPAPGNTPNPAPMPSTAGAPPASTNTNGTLTFPPAHGQPDRDLFPRQMSSTLKLICARKAPRHLAAILDTGTCMARLCTIRDGWRFDHLVHNDLKLDNVQLCAGPPAGGLPGSGQLRIVDWELVDRGDPAWDLACVLVSYLQLWVLGSCDQADHAPLLKKLRAHLPLLPDHVRAACHAFHHAYFGPNGAAVPDHDRLGNAILARLAVISYEMSVDAEQLPAGAEFFARLLVLLCDGNADPTQALFALGRMAPITAHTGKDA